MNTPAQVRANRRNSTKSTGPRTLAGKARSSQNAKKHALNVPVQHFASLQADMDALARLIAGDEPEAACFEAACSIAEAQIDLKRVKAARSVLLNAHNSTHEPAETIPELARDLLRLDRYERRARWRRQQAVRNFHLAIHGYNKEHLST
jgi:hypothetical protein